MNKTVSSSKPYDSGHSGAKCNNQLLVTNKSLTRLLSISRCLCSIKVHLIAGPIGQLLSVCVDPKCELSDQLHCCDDYIRPYDRLTLNRRSISQMSKPSNRLLPAIANCHNVRHRCSDHHVTAPLHHHPNHDANSCNEAAAKCWCNCNSNTNKLMSHV